MYDSPAYLTPFINTKAARILPAFIKGAGGRHIKDKRDGTYEDIAIYGVEFPDLFKRTLNFWYIDNGYFKPSTPREACNGYYRIIRNSWYSNGIGQPNLKKFKKYNIKLENWKKRGDKIILVPPSKYMAPVLGEHDWLDKTKEKLSGLTDRKIEVSTKKNPLRWNDSIWCIVTCISNVQVEAIIKGISVITTRFTNLGSLDNIESPPGEEIRDLLYVLAGQQWNLDEMKNGRAWEDLNGSKI